jgi:hypothetical protein
MKIFCKIGIHFWKWFKSEFPFVVIYKCKWCGKEKEEYQGI